MARPTLPAPTSATRSASSARPASPARPRKAGRRAPRGGGATAGGGGSGHSHSSVIGQLRQVSPARPQHHQRPAGGALRRQPGALQTVRALLLALAVQRRPAAGADVDGGG